MGFLIELLGELLLQVIGEALVEIGFHAVSESFRRDPNPWLAAIGYAILGSMFGGASVLTFPRHLTPPGLPRYANAVLTPIAAGFAMSLLGRWRAARGEPVLRIDRFSYGFLFAAAATFIRFLFAR